MLEVQVIDDPGHGFGRPGADAGSDPGVPGRARLGHERGRADRRDPPEGELPPAGVSRTAGLVQLVEKRPRRGLTERIVQSSARFLRPLTRCAGRERSRSRTDRSPVSGVPARGRRADRARRFGAGSQGRACRQAAAHDGDRGRDQVRVRRRPSRFHRATDGRGDRPGRRVPRRVRTRWTLAPTRHLRSSTSPPNRGIVP